MKVIEGTFKKPQEEEGPVKVVNILEKYDLDQLELDEFILVGSINNKMVIVNHPSMNLVEALGVLQTHIFSMNMAMAQGGLED